MQQTPRASIHGFTCPGDKVVALCYLASRLMGDLWEGWHPGALYVCDQWRVKEFPGQQYLCPPNCSTCLVSHIIFPRLHVHVHVNMLWFFFFQQNVYKLPLGPWKLIPSSTRFANMPYPAFKNVFQMASVNMASPEVILHEVIQEY